MTESQRDHFYFPAFNRCCRANNWRMTKGRLTCDPQSNLLLPELAQVWTYARQIAEADHRGITPRDLRYACHIVAIGSPKASDKLRNKEVNRVVDLFNVIQDPDNLEFRSRWENPELARRQSLVETIKKLVPYAYAKQIANDLAQRGGEYDWEREMPLEMLENLHNIAMKRNPRRTQPQHVGRVSSRGAAVGDNRPTTPFPKLEYIKKVSTPATAEPQLVEGPF